MNSIERTEKELQFEKKRLKQAGGEVLAWLEKTPPSKVLTENPWILAGLAAGVGFLLSQWMTRRDRD